MYAIKNLCTSDLDDWLCSRLGPDVPHYPEANEIVEVKGGAYFIVARVERETEQVICNPLHKVGSLNPRWKPSLLEIVTQPISNIICNIAFEIRAGCYYLHI